MVRCSSLEDPKFEAGKCALEAESWRATRTIRGSLHACATDLPLWLMKLGTTGGVCLPLMIFVLHAGLLSLALWLCNEEQWKP